MGYYLRRGKKTLGPLSEDKIKKGVITGQVMGSDLIASSESGPWKSVDESSDFQISSVGHTTQKSTPPPVTKPRTRPPAAQSPRVATSSQSPMELRSESEYATVVHGPYDVVFDLMRNSMSEMKGKIKNDSMPEGNLLAKWRYGINPFGLSVSVIMRDAGNGWIRVEVKGFFTDAIDTFGHAKKKARQLMSHFHSLVEQQSSATSSRPNLSAAGPRLGPCTPSPTSAGSGKSYSGMATASLMCGIGGLLICGAAGIAAIILGIIALNGMSSSRNNTGHGSAVTGIVLGGITLVVWSLIVLANV